MFNKKVKKILFKLNYWIQRYLQKKFFSSQAWFELSQLEAQKIFSSQAWLELSQLEAQKIFSSQAWLELSWLEAQKKFQAGSAWLEPSYIRLSSSQAEFSSK